MGRRLGGGRKEGLELTRHAKGPILILVDPMKGEGPKPLEVPRLDQPDQFGVETV